MTAIRIGSNGFNTNSSMRGGGITTNHSFNPHPRSGASSSYSGNTGHSNSARSASSPFVNTGFSPQDGIPIQSQSSLGSATKKRRFSGPVDETIPERPPPDFSKGDVTDSSVSQYKGFLSLDVLKQYYVSMKANSTKELLGMKHGDSPSIDEIFGLFCTKEALCLTFETVLRSGEYGARTMAKNSSRNTLAVLPKVEAQVVVYEKEIEFSKRVKSGTITDIGAVGREDERSTNEMITRMQRALASRQAERADQIAKENSELESVVKQEMFVKGAKSHVAGIRACAELLGGVADCDSRESADETWRQLSEQGMKHFPQHHKYFPPDVVEKANRQNRLARRDFSGEMVGGDDGVDDSQTVLTKQSYSENIANDNVEDDVTAMMESTITKIRMRPAFAKKHPNQASQDNANLPQPTTDGTDANHDLFLSSAASVASDHAINPE